MDIRKTTREDIPEVLKIYEYSREYMKKNGNPNQWIDGYPQKKVIENDIDKHIHYLCFDDSNILGCFALYEGDDPTYQIIENGMWLNDDKYTVIHRLATAKQGKGIGQFCIEWCMKKYKNIKVDTHKDNVVMQKLLLKNDFQKCGIIYNHWGDERIAYQKG